MGMMEREGYVKYLSLAVAAILIAFGVAQLLRRKPKPRSFREDPIGALKDRSGIMAGKAQEATEEALARVQDTLDEIRGRLPELNRRRLEKRRKELNRRIADIGDQAQELLKELRANSAFSR
jgi:hypothetical protein